MTEAIDFFRQISQSYGMEGSTGFGRSDFPVIRRAEERLAVLDLRRRLDRIGLADLPGHPLRLAYGSVRVYDYILEWTIRGHLGLPQASWDRLRVDKIAAALELPSKHLRIKLAILLTYGLIERRGFYYVVTLERLNSPEGMEHLDRIEAELMICGKTMLGIQAARNRDALGLHKGWVWPKMEELVPRPGKRGANFASPPFLICDSSRDEIGEAAPASTGVSRTTRTKTFTP